MTAVGVTGATGRMGREILAALSESEDLALAIAISRREATVDGITVLADDDLSGLLEERRPDVLVDFTVAEAVSRYAGACATAGVPFVTGTTGLDEEVHAALEAASESVPVLQAANFAPGVHVLGRAVRTAVEALEGYDIEVTETHHNGKRDAPSGTAKRLLAAIDTARTDPETRTGGSDHVYGREGHHRRRSAEVGVHVRRAGDVRGEHEVLLADHDEVLTLTHRAESRGVFAAGALDAARWLVDQEPGLYDFEAVL